MLQLLEPMIRQYTAIHDGAQLKLQEFTNALSTNRTGAQKVQIYFQILQLLMSSALDNLAWAADPDNLMVQWNDGLENHFFQVEAAVKVCSSVQWYITQK